MRIVYVNYYYSPQFNQPEIWLNRIEPFIGVAEELAKTNNVICVEQISYQGQLHYNGVDYKFFDPKKTKTLFPLKLNLLIKKILPAVVIIHGTVFPLQSMLLRLCLGKHVTIIIQNHAENAFKGWRKKMQYIADFFVDAYFFPAKEMSLNWVKNGNICSTKKVHTILEGSSYFKILDRQTAITKTNVSEQPIYLWVGRLDANKNPVLVVKAFIQFLKIYPLAKLYLIYYTNDLLDDIQALLNANDVCKTQIILVGKLPHNEMQYWFNSADFIVSSSFKEGTSIVLAEATSCGCIPILTAIPPYKVMTNNGYCGLLYEAGNEDALLAALIKSTQINITEERQKVLVQFDKNLSFKAIAASIESAIFKIKNDL